MGERDDDGAPFWSVAISTQSRCKADSSRSTCQDALSLDGGAVIAYNARVWTANNKQPRHISPFRCHSARLGLPLTRSESDDL